MKKLLFGALAVGLLIAADKSKDDDTVKKELAKLQGTWVLLSMEFGGQKAPEDEVKGGTLTFEGDKATFKRQGKDHPATFKIDPTQKPAHLDIMPTEGAEKGKTLKMIYALDGDTLKIAGGEGDDTERPTEFVSKEGSKTGVMTLKKEKK